MTHAAMETGQALAMNPEQKGMAQVVTRIAPVEAAGVPRKKLTLAEVRARLDGKTGKRYWKNLDELAETPEFQELMHEEFHEGDGRELRVSWPGWLHQAAG